MSDTIPDPQPSPTAPARLPVNLFMDHVVDAVHRHEARACRAAAPYRYSLGSTAGFSGLPIRLLQKLCRDGWFQSTKIGQLPEDTLKRLCWLSALMAPATSRGR